MRIDLHTHSTASDGTCSPAQLVAEAAAAGLSAIAITDHDTIAGWPQAQTAAQDLGVGLIGGMELSCIYRGISVHLLSYAHRPDSAELAREAEASRTSRVTRAKKIVAKLALSYEITWDQVLAQVAPGATIGRPHIADALVAQGIIPDRSAGFAGVLRSGGPYDLPRYSPELRMAIGLIRQAGGVPVLAHPLARARGPVLAPEDFEVLTAAGVMGVEVQHRDHNSQDRALLADLAKGLGIFTTGSSDFHGAGKPNLLGENLTHPDVLAEILDRGEGLPLHRVIAAS